MIHEFAINPELISEWCENRDRYTHFKKAFGVGTPRIISPYPDMDAWINEVKKTLSGKTDSESTRIIEMIARIREDKSIKRSGSIYDINLAWIDNIVKENKDVAYHAIVSNCKRTDSLNVIPVREVANTDTEPLWDVKMQDDETKRNALEIAGAVDSMLLNCSEVIFVDPHFSPDTSTCKNVFKEYFVSLMKKRSRIKLNRVEILGSIGKKVEKDPIIFGKLINHYKEKCLNYFIRILPPKLAITIRFLEQYGVEEKVHNRYILTDIGGVSFGNSHQEGDGTDDIYVMEKKKYLLKWEKYAGEKPAFKVLWEIKLPQA